jgi:hypothetical protein
MNAFLIDLSNKPGELARIAEAIADKGIDITAFTGATCGDSGTVAIMTNDEAGTAKALGQGGFRHRTVELVSASLANKPGSLATAARRLADAGVNIEAAMPTGMTGGNVQLAFATDNPAKAREALGETVTAGAYSR